MSPYPTVSPNPTTTSSPSLCTGNTPNWTDAYGFGCDLYEEYDSPGCPWYGDDFNGTMGSARDNCCYCSSTYSRSPSTSPKPTVSPNPTYGWSPTVSPYPTYGPYPTVSPTTSSDPSTTSSPSLCTGNTPNWTNAYGDGCDWYEEYDLPGCPWLGDRYNGIMGVARDNCCYCSSTYSRSPSTSPKPTVSPNPTYGRSPTVSPYPTYGRPPTVSPYPTYAPTTSSDPTTTSRPSTCSDSTPNWTSSYGSTCKDLEYEDPSCENGFFYYSESMGPAAINCCHCFDKVEICTVKSSSSEPTKMPSTSKPTTSKPTTKMVSLLNYDNCER